MMNARPHPVASVIIANFNGEKHILDTLASVARQTLQDIEIIVADDGSTDSSPALIETFASADRRVVYLPSDRNGGPAAARNRALAVAAGEWIAVVDGDDLIHPRRLAYLVASAEAQGCDIIADNPIAFDSERKAVPQPMLPPRLADRPFSLDAVSYVKANALGSKEPPLGYLKPVIRRAMVKDVAYEEGLRIAEDYDLLLRLLLRGATFLVVPQPLYYYRRHPASISHRLSVEKLKPMIDADLRLREQLRLGGELGADLEAAFQHRATTLADALLFERIVASAKSHAWLQLLALSARHPLIAARLRHALFNAFTSRLVRDRTAVIQHSGKVETYLFRGGDGSLVQPAGSAPAGEVIVEIDPAVTLLPSNPGSDVHDGSAAVAQAISIMIKTARPAGTLRSESPSADDWLAFALQPQARVVDAAAAEREPA